LQAAAIDTGQNLLVQGFGPIVHTGFTSLKTVNDYRDTFSYDRVKLGKFIAGLHNKGIRVIGRGLWYISAAHTEADIDYAIDIAREVMAEIKM
jgi:glutamate-1-semialdehyde 2,1-aminomutase